ncbi:hypothetical protein MMC07_006824 [Pseudocyphellaria aurata]|nr:hypothetical protein [Pseudocyphellaria aurata]
MPRCTATTLSHGIHTRCLHEAWDGNFCLEHIRTPSQASAETAKEDQSTPHDVANVQVIELRQTVQTLTEQLQQLRQQHKILQVDREHDSAQLLQLQKQYKNSQAEREREAAQNERLHRQQLSEAAHHKQLAQQASQVLASKQAEMDALVADQAQAQSGYQSLQQHEELMSLQHRAIANALEEADRELAETQAQLQASRARISELEQQVASQAERARADAQHATIALAAKQEELLAVQDAMHSCQAGMSRWQTEHHALTVELAQTRKNLADQESIAASSMLLAQRLQSRGS